MQICVVIDHYSRKVMAAIPLEEPNTGWINNALESAIEKYGPPRHLISDQAKVFIGDVFTDLLNTYEIVTQTADKSHRGEPLYRLLPTRYSPPQGTNIHFP